MLLFSVHNKEFCSQLLRGGCVCVCVCVYVCVRAHMYVYSLRSKASYFSAFWLSFLISKMELIIASRGTIV